MACGWRSWGTMSTPPSPTSGCPVLRSSTAPPWAAGWRWRCSPRTAPSPPAPGALALPEAFIGLVPGWGGVYILPRLIGPENAVKVMIENPLSNNRTLTGQQAFGLGIADALFEPATSWSSPWHGLPA